ncbi:competence type IV pilus major pilin ComGC [Fructilactobacillus fructivorans]|nr:competence type IV pilus major pilin ComGC [Fructilactobacillus fructivorans]MCT0151186.1 prepilin-type N-terminal cleavage/methylation domain-containing protein [Fructilactobacillus fructivorans]MCT2867737.1 prepilin-type N-terminal cleavage/methylation domain-containing protein [Fructilactobacillus fructivorans]MCT2868745.1 prepilin-type N-terminal cleavage/methylation domain-containing protein [Fructilactobacillus fructivorans]MCT2874085.1 prepilin-type N-terminal cleavage/methylation dom
MNRKGFTLIEMTIVLFIISLLVLIIIPNLSNQKDHAKKIHGSAMVSVIQTQIDAYQDENHDGDVTINKLVRSHYLTGKQANQAHAERIVVVKNHAMQK